MQAFASSLSQRLLPVRIVVELFAGSCRWSKAAALAGEWSPFFLEQVTRNRIYVLLKHRSWGLGGRALLALGRDTAVAGLGWLRQALTAPRDSGPAFRQFWPRVKALAWLAWTAPAVLRARRREMELGGLSEEELAEWVVEA